MKTISHNTNPKRILISRTDSIGDVVLTLPLCGWLKEQLPGVEILFMGRTYTLPVLLCCEHIDSIVNWDEIASLPYDLQKATFKALNVDAILHVFPVKNIAKLAALSHIPNRIGTRGRLYHFLYCNALIPLSRKNSGLHEAHLNILLAKGFYKNLNSANPDLAVYYGFNKMIPEPGPADPLLDKTKFNLIIHPKSKGSAREWPLEKYRALIEALPKEKIHVFISGTHQEGELMEGWLNSLPPYVHNLTGRLSLMQLIHFIQKSDGLLAASTGPLHIAAALGKMALGLYPPIKPMDPSRWAPVGKHAHFVVRQKSCSKCRKAPSQCFCMQEIDVQQVLSHILNALPQNLQ